ncbi:hypothetical protein BAUCODRAFT_33842 [Baudoinia panamericana UAMH 10762]|uniref:Uncharacterized protein n=1 Tax=Baudoinia panamericana (strain UAMH 10762) TaxID=717646 RepID=M2NBF8_BAUPA|nr:uncharacterized protein BAUCODRAFT_33842 [Baudoinia panamericana UAMH 10762]EMC96484.1 hypothetical protein BAUCODRAFT_33842 [Baudoinia panamericana UAMH 10762]
MARKRPYVREPNRQVLCLSQHCPSASAKYVLSMESGRTMRRFSGAPSVETGYMLARHGRSLDSSFIAGLELVSALQHKNVRKTTIRTTAHYVRHADLVTMSHSGSIPVL